MEPAAPHLGVLAFGDSITNAGGELQYHIALQSWALWTARALGLPYTGYAVDGAVVEDVLGEQIPAFVERAADPDGPFDLGCLYIGVNNLLGPRWDAASFARAHLRAVSFLAERCVRVVCLTTPLALGRPRAAAAHLRALNDAVCVNAAARGALVVSLDDFGARNHVMVDQLHPTALGQVAIAQRALRVLAADGMSVRVDPARLIAPKRTRLDGVRGDWAYVYRDLKQRLRS